MPRSSRRPRAVRRVVVVGTGTEIGKTHVTCCLLAAARAFHVKVGAYKPIATGVRDLCDDAERHAAASGQPYVAPTYAYRRPVSPHLAAREEGRPVDLDVVRARAEELAAGLEVQIVEGAGGLFTPIGPHATNADLVRALGELGPVTLLLVAPDRLGVLHDVGAAVRAATASGLPKPVVALSTPEPGDYTTGTNAEELVALGLADEAIVFPRASPSSPASVSVAEVLLRRA